MFIAGAVVQWLRDGLQIIRAASDIEALAASVPDNGGVYFVPAFAGLGAPHWDPYARGSIFGLTRGTTAGHIARAALESIAFQSADVLDAMQKDAGIDAERAARRRRRDGQQPADAIPGRRARRAGRAAAGARDHGARRRVSRGPGGRLLEEHDEIAANWRVDRRFEPNGSRAAASLMAGWKHAVARRGNGGRLRRAMSNRWRQIFKRGDAGRASDSSPIGDADVSPAGESTTSTQGGASLTDHDTLIAAGHALEDRGEFEAALDRYQKATATAPYSPRAHMNVANALQRLNRSEEAIEALGRAITCAPDFAPAHVNLGMLLKDRGEADSAERELLEALRLQPSMVEPNVVLADLYEIVHRFDEAEACFERALELGPRNAATLLNYGMYASRRKNFDKALGLYERARSVEPGFSDVYSVMLFALNLRTDVDVASIADLHREVGIRMTNDAGPAFTEWTNRATTRRRLRVGYVSGDFLMHPIAVFAPDPRSARPRVLRDLLLFQLRRAQSDRRFSARAQRPLAGNCGKHRRRFRGPPSETMRSTSSSTCPVTLLAIDCRSLRGIRRRFRRHGWVTSIRRVCRRWTTVSATGIPTLTVPRR